MWIIVCLILYIVYLYMVNAISLMGGSPGANENRINIHFVRYTSHLSEIFVSPTSAKRNITVLLA